MVNILGVSEVDLRTAEFWCVTRGATIRFFDLAELYWLFAPERGVRPEVGFAQACHETGFGRYGRAVTPEHNNFCGLKVTKPVGPDSNPDDHDRFPTAEVGVIAHLDHLALYAGAKGYPRQDTPDGRHFPYLLGKSSTVEGLSGGWAPSSSYSAAILVNLEQMADLQK